MYCNLLKSHKTAKTFLGKAWHWNRIFLEILGKSLEAARPSRVEPWAPGHDGADRF